jgi:hypothetical protein
MTTQTGVAFPVSSRDGTGSGAKRRMGWTHRHPDHHVRAAGTLDQVAPEYRLGIASGMILVNRMSPVPASIALLVSSSC